MTNPFGQTISIATTFFSLMVGVGLSRILEPEKFHETFPEDRWYCFVAALLLFLRFLFGSANHLWKEFGARDFDTGARNSIIWHLFCLILFGFIAIRICYTYDALDFLVWNIRFGLVAVAFAFFGLIMKTDESVFGQNWSKGWFGINAVQAVVAYGILKWVECEKAGEGISSNFNLPLTCLVATFAILLFCDLGFQLRKVGEAASGAGRPAAT